MATKKKAAKPAAKPAKKSAPAKPASTKKPAVKKPVKKAAPAAKKPATKKPAVKAAVKKTVKKVTKVIKKAAKPVVKAAVKKTVNKPMKKKEEVKKAVKKAAVSVKKPAAKASAPVKAIKEPVKPKSPEKAKDIKIVPAKPVTLPKINTKTSRKYQPEFTRSVLDQPVHDLGAPIVRYSDADLAEFREIIQRKLDSAKKELAYLQGLITRKDEMGGDNDDARYMTMEDGSMSMEREQLSQMASRQITFIDHLEKAIMRIENKTYGICRVTGQLIDKARLRAVPHATLSIEAKMGVAK